MDSNIIFPKRKQLRLNNYNYNSVGAYFITICTHERKCILSNIVGAIHESPEHKLSQYGKIVDEIINNTSNYKNAQKDKYVIMPNHIHFLISIIDEDKSNYYSQLRAIRESPLRNERSVISKLIGYIKMNVSKSINERFNETKIWQRGFHDHIVRNEFDYEKIAKYIEENPIKWHLDCFFVNEESQG
ncbi:MAG: transposase [Clostridia bacterium]|nr:transposase [Clostridia bacterium]